MAVGLASGSQGEVVHMQLVPGTAPPALPEVWFAPVAGYSGPPYSNETRMTVGGEHTGLRNAVPVGPIDAFDDQPPAAKRGCGGAQGPGHTCCIRSRLSVMLSFAITHHQSQSDTLNRVVVDIGSREINDDQTSTTLSRCQT
ncbi:unnamed protein product, partial [Laminaria digitata]